MPASSDSRLACQRGPRQLVGAWKGEVFRISAVKIVAIAFVQQRCVVYVVGDARNQSDALGGSLGTAGRFRGAILMFPSFSLFR